MTAASSSPSRSTASSVAKMGTPRTKLLVPSIGSMYQRIEASPSSVPYSSPTRPWAGKAARIRSRTRRSIAWSASVTRFRSGFVETRRSRRKWARAIGVRLVGDGEGEVEPGAAVGVGHRGHARISDRRASVHARVSDSGRSRRRRTSCPGRARTRTRSDRRPRSSRRTPCVSSSRTSLLGEARLEGSEVRARRCRRRSGGCRGPGPRCRRDPGVRTARSRGRAR